MMLPLVVDVPSGSKSNEYVAVDRSATEPPAEAAARELGVIVARHVSALPPRQREVLVLIAFEEHSAAEAARVLDISEQNVRTNLHLAREKLRELLAPFLSESGI